MIKGYKNKMIKKVKNKSSITLVPKFVGTERYFPTYKKKVKFGDLFPEFPLGEARTRDDFVIVRRKNDR